MKNLNLTNFQLKSNIIDSAELYKKKNHERIALIFNNKLNTDTIPLD